jgi:hypothetical protein
METGTSDQSRVDGEKGADRRKLTAAERQAVRRFKERVKANPALRFKMTDNGRSFILELDDSQKVMCPPWLMKELAATDKDFIDGILAQLSGVVGMHDELSLKLLNVMLSAINGIEPRDPLETMLAVQMATVHVAAMHVARDVVFVGRHHPENAQCLAKLTRTFTAQMEALKRHRANEEKGTLQPRPQGEKPAMRKVTKPTRARMPEQRVAASEAIASKRTNVVAMRTAKQGR